MATGGKLKRIRHRIKRGVQRFYLLLNRIRPPGLDGAGIYDVGRFFVLGMTDRRFTLSAMAMAYRFFFAVFPALILIFTLIPYVPVENLHDRVLEFLETVVPGDSLGFVTLIVDEFFNKPSPGLIYLNIGLLLFSSLGGIKVMMQAFSKDSELFKDRNFIRHNLVAFVIMLLLLLLFVIMLGALIAGELGVAYLHQNGTVGEDLLATLFQIFYWLVIFITLEVGVSILYYLGPATQKRWKFFSPGSLVGGLLILLAVNAFRVFFLRFTDYNKIYGSLGAIMVLMVWFYWISIVLLIGFELNAAIEAAKHRHQKKGGAPSPARDRVPDPPQENLPPTKSQGPDRSGPQDTSVD
ncbi:MAG: YihY/virulence factor BrkB family protein [Bacteroidota bacterium]